ncbi:hypothetical protein [Sphingorhabdus sp.]|uniref:hypothetical protein n=1 Tax=Sphingorhabdus sp. TaxID=1902408 RepID=UPI00391A5C91
MHFFAVYIIGSVFPGTKTAAFLVLVITIAILALTFALFVRAFRAGLNTDDGLQRWMTDLTVLGYALAGVAIIYQGLPAILQLI